MRTDLGWQEIAWRLSLAAVAGAVVGLDRGEHGRPAGLRTTLLVCLAAAVSMLQTNLLLATAGRPPDSFVMLDLMRLPLGILTGMGFIGGGAILKKGDVVLGVTTAATLWFVTVVGLCLGGGQTALGLAALAIGMVVLKGLKHLEVRLPRERRAVLTVTGATGGATDDDDVRAEVIGRGFRFVNSGVRYDKEKGCWTLCGEVRWRGRESDPPLPEVVKVLARRPGVSRLDWSPLGYPGVRTD